MADETYVRKALAPYTTRIRQVVERGYADWLKSSDKVNFIYERSRANSRFDHIARHAHLEFGRDKDVRIISEHETVKLLFCKGTIVLRFKHADECGLGANHETQTVLAFIDATQPFLLGLPVQHKVECCFRQNDLDTALDSIAITARHMYSKLWSYELPKPEAEVVPFTPPFQPSPQAPVVQLRDKTRNTKKESSKDSKD